MDIAYMLKNGVPNDTFDPSDLKVIQDFAKVFGATGIHAPSLECPDDDGTLVLQMHGYRVAVRREKRNFRRKCKSIQATYYVEDMVERAIVWSQADEGCDDTEHACKDLPTFLCAIYQDIMFYYASNMEQSQAMYNAYKEDEQMREAAQAAIRNQ
jgi:hypothetical protein